MKKMAVKTNKRRNENRKKEERKKERKKERGNKTCVLYIYLSHLVIISYDDNTKVVCIDVHIRTYLAYGQQQL